MYYTLTDNWVQIAVRFITEDHGIRGLNDAMSRDILREFNNAGIGMASGTYEVVGFPKVKVRVMDARKRRSENYNCAAANRARSAPLFE